MSNKAATEKFTKKKKRCSIKKVRGFRGFKLFESELRFYIVDNVWFKADSVIIPLLWYL